MSLPAEEDSLEGKSWVEICDAERAQEEKLRNEKVDISTRSEETEQRVSENKKLSENEAAIRSIDKPVVESQKTYPVGRMDESLEEGEIRNEFEEKMYFKTPQKLYPAECRTPISYAKVVKGLKSEPDYIPLTNETVNTDDLSLTSHLDVFHVASPLKVTPKKEVRTNIALDEDTVMYSPFKKKEIPIKNMKRPFQLIESPKPRPRSASDSSIHKIAKSVAHSDVHSSTIEETEENIASGSEDGKEKSVSSPNLKRELEVNPEILSRRQKQIDYGKNTLGYDRYVKVIPKHKRTKEHPKTPPKHLKMSRRTWDGLIKNWRLKLHRWDPISEKDELDFDNANFDQFSFSSEEPSSYDSSSIRSDSAPSTPKPPPSVTETEEGNDPQWIQSNSKSECSKELWSDCKEETKESNNDEFLGCELLTENCVKAYS